MVHRAMFPSAGVVLVEMSWGTRPKRPQHDLRRGILGPPRGLNRQAKLDVPKVVKPRFCRPKSEPHQALMIPEFRVTLNTIQTGRNEKRLSAEAHLCDEHADTLIRRKMPRL